MSLTFGSLFSGIGGIDLGLERAGMTCKWQVEINEYCNRVLAKHWPDVPRFRDVRRCGAGNLVPVDLICGGFPCQPHSLAGKRLASRDDRDLWGEFARIIRELRPRWVLAENVRGLLSSESGRFFGRVLGDLAASGYDAEWDIVSAASIGAPHLRERLFILAYPARGGNAQQSGILDGEALERARAGAGSRAGGGDSAPRIFVDRRTAARGAAPLADAQGVGQSWPITAANSDGQPKTPPGDRSPSVADPERQSLALGESGARDAGQKRPPVERNGGGGGARRLAYADGEPLVWTAEPRPQCAAWDVEPAVGRLVDGLSARLARKPLMGYGNAVVPQVAEYIGRRIVEVAR